MGIQVPDNWEPLDSNELEKLGEGLKIYAEKLRALDRERADVIVIAVQLEELMGNVLMYFLIDDKASRQVVEEMVGNFGARNKLAFCLGLISNDEANDLDIIRKIRNYFAHTKECSFNDQKVIDLCKKLRIPKQRPELFENYSSFETFQSVSFVLGENLTSRAWNGKKRKCVVPGEIDSKSWEEFWA